MRSTNPGRLSRCGAYAGHLAGAPFAVALIASTAGSFDLGQAAAYLQLAAWGLGVGSCIASKYAGNVVLSLAVCSCICSAMSIFLSYKNASVQLSLLA